MQYKINNDSKAPQYVPIKISNKLSSVDVFNALERLSINIYEEFR